MGYYDPSSPTIEIYGVNLIVKYIFLLNFFF